MLAPLRTTTVQYNVATIVTSGRERFSVELYALDVANCRKMKKLFGCFEEIKLEENLYIDITTQKTQYCAKVEDWFELAGEGS